MKLTLKKRNKLKKSVSEYTQRLKHLQSILNGKFHHLVTKHEKLLALCKNSENMKTGIEICNSGTDYHSQGDVKTALEKITIGLGILVPALQSEPKGIRKELLRDAVNEWMSFAERIKQEDELRSIDVKADFTNSEEKQNCIIQ